MKSYTDIEQSHELADILPFESADMYYILMPDGVYNHFPLTGRKTELAEDTDFPCWSLAALLGVLPEGTRLLKSANISSVGDIKYHCDCPSGTIDKWYDNPIDACYEMIIKLNELNLL